MILKLLASQIFFKKKNYFEKSETMVQLLNVLNNKISKRINYIFITLDKTKKLEKSEIIFFYLLINLFKKEKLKDKIMVLFSSNKSNESSQDNIKIINKLFNYEQNLFEEKFDSYFSSLFNPEFYYINNNIIYDKKDIEEWKKMDETIKNIANKISLNKSESIDNNKINLINDIIFFEGIIEKKLKILTELEKYNKKEKIILITYLLNSNINKDISPFILYLYNKIIEPKKELQIYTTDITFIKDKYNNINLMVYSKIKFTDLKKINGENYGFNDQILRNVKNLFTSKLILLNLQNNQISDLTIFNSETFSNLENLNLSNNNISNINIFSNYKCNNLKTLNLSHNKISDIKCFSNDDSLNFKKLEILDLSYNNIKKMNKINIKSIKTLALLNNELLEDINDFMNNYCFNTDKVKIEDNNNGLNFHYLREYHDDINIKFNYIVEEKNKNNLLKALSFKGIERLILEKFNNIDFLANELIINNVRYIYINNGTIIKGFDSFNSFKSIKAYSIKVDYTNNKYICKIEFRQPFIVLNYSFDDLNFLKYDLLKETYWIKIPQKIFNDNQNYFSYDAIKNSFPIFKQLKTYKLNIDYNSNLNKYECTCYFNHDINLKYMFNDLLFLKDDIFSKTRSIIICNSIINDNLDLSRKRFPNLYYIKLENNRIEGMRIFNDINDIKKLNAEIIEYNKKVDNKYYEKELIEIISNSNICNNNLLGNLNDAKFDMNIIDNKNNEIKLNYYNPFNFYVLINKSRLNEIKSFKTCTKIDINNAELSYNDLGFLNNGSLFYLNYIYLNGNKITNIDFLDKIASKCLYSISIKNNLLDNGIESINNNNNFSCSNLEVKIKEDNKNMFMLSFSYDGKYRLYFDYLYDANKNLDILNGIHFGYLYKLNLSNLNLKNIDFLSNRTLSLLKVLYLDSNNIEDINIFKNENLQFRLYELSIKNNPIRKGIHVLNNEFFKRSIYMELSVTKYEKEFKISSNYKYPFYDIEFYVNNTNDIINVLDFNNNYIKLNTNNIEEIKVIENAIKSSESIDNRKKIFEVILFMIIKLPKL